jgi:hypothetical protein
MQAAITCMRDETVHWATRLKAIEVILDRVRGAPDQHMLLHQERCEHNYHPCRR